MPYVDDIKSKLELHHYKIYKAIHEMHKLFGLSRRTRQVPYVPCLNLIL